jgi:hypothetical protein
MINLYLDDVNGRISDSDEYTPLFSAGDIYIEHYQSNNLRLSFAYSEFDKKLGILASKRDAFLHLNDFDSCVLVGFGVPDHIYQKSLTCGKTKNGLTMVMKNTCMLKAPEKVLF